MPPTDMAHTAFPNGPFDTAKRPVPRYRTGRFAMQSATNTQIPEPHHVTATGTYRSPK